MEKRRKNRFYLAIGLFLVIVALAFVARASAHEDVMCSVTPTPTPMVSCLITPFPTPSTEIPSPTLPDVSLTPTVTPGDTPTPTPTEATPTPGVAGQSAQQSTPEAAPDTSLRMW